MSRDNSLESLVEKVSDKPAALVRLALVLLSRNQTTEALRLCSQAVALAPDDTEVASIASLIRSRSAGDWYFNMVRDNARNRAMSEALSRAVTLESLVLDIGTGTGLFAMMCARLGAASIVSCEPNAVVADVASQIVARNGYSDRLHIVPKPSSDLQIGRDLPRKADVVICDVFGSNMIGLGVLPIFEHAVANLLAEGGKIFPARGTLRVALAELDESRSATMGQVEGFDLSLFNQLAAPTRAVSVGTDGFAIHSDAADLFRFDFSTGGPFPSARAEKPLRSHGGRVTGIAQWIRFDLDDAAFVENSPATATKSAFALVFYRLPQPVDTVPGEEVVVCASHDRQHIHIWTKPKGAL